MGPAAFPATGLPHLKSCVLPTETTETTLQGDPMLCRRRRTASRLGARLDDSHLGYTMITALERFLASFTAPFVVIIGLLLLALIGLVDAVTGSLCRRRVLPGPDRARDLRAWTVGRDADGGNGGARVVGRRARPARHRPR